MTYLAREYTHDHIGKYLEIIERCCDHRPWFNDYVWEKPELKRVAVREYLADAVANGKLWEVYKADTEGVALVGIMMLNRVSFKMDAYCHFLFFDHDLGGKRGLCLEAMDWCFRNLELEVLRLEVPTYAKALGLWARRKLGFRYDAEVTLDWWLTRRKPTRRFLEAASSKRKAILHKGNWHDAVQLSVTRDEFHEWTVNLKERGQHRSVSGPDEPDPGATAGIPAEPTEHPSTVSSSITTSATD